MLMSTSDILPIPSELALHHQVQYHGAENERIECVLSQKPGVKFLESLDRLEIKINKDIFFFKICNRNYNILSKDCQKKLIDDFKSRDDFPEIGDMKLLHGCSNKNKSCTNTISFSVDMEDISKQLNNKIQLGYCEEKFLLKINNGHVKQIEKNKIFPINGFCYDVSCTPK